MAGRIPQSFIDELLQRLDIVDVIDSRVALKKSGRNYVACCPFHNEKTPSFSVSPEKQFFHCFGCGASGNLIGFVMDFERLDFVDAIELLAHSQGLTVPREGGTSRSQPQDDSRQPLYPLLEASNRYFQQQLRQHPDAPRAVAYLRQRGLSGEVAKQFNIGFAPPGWDNLQKTLTSQGHKPQDMLQSGMLTQNDQGRSYDRFRDRVMFPIRDRRGRVIAFGGRVLDDSKPKYLNSPESPVFHKGNELYGFYEARQALRSLDRVLIVEGYMDVVALAQFGIHYAMATLGTATSSEHITRLFRLCPEIVFCFDGDQAGRAAALRGLETALPQMQDGRQAKFMFLPDGDDPDSLIRRIGKQDFEQAITQAQPLSEFLLQHLLQQCDIHSLDGRARLANLAQPYLAKLPEDAYRTLLIQQLAELTKLPSQQLQGKQASKPTTTKPNPKTQGTSPLRQFLALWVQYPGLIQHLDDLGFIEYLPAPAQAIALRLLEILAEYPQITSGGLLEYWRDSEHYTTISQLAQWQPTLPDEAPEASFINLAQRLRRDALEQQLKRLQEKDLAHRKTGSAALTDAEKAQFKYVINALAER